jgi:UDP-glucose:(heptosyl)LPS alpha-1,3-glucosyltransferase
VKIALLIERLNPARGGAERWTADFARKLADEGHDVHVFSRGGGVAADGVTLHAVPVFGVGRALRTLSFARNVARLVAAEHFDIVHGVGKTYSQDVYQPHGGVHAATLRAGLTMHGSAGRAWRCLTRRLSPKQWAFRRIARMQYTSRPAQVFVALSDMVKRDMLLFHGVPEDRIEVVYNGVDVERFHPRNRERVRARVRQRHRIGEDELVFLIIAHNSRLKGVPELVACVTGELPPCRLLVVGGGREASLMQYADRRAPGRVIFTGAVEDAAPYYAAADAYVHPTYYDPCSLVVLEALASALPVVTSSRNGASELMTDGQEGYVIAPPPDGLGALSERLKSLFSRELREKMAANARTVAEQHTIDDNCRSMMGVYDKALRRKGKIT